MPLVPAFERKQRQVDLREFEANQVSRMSFKTELHTEKTYLRKKK